MRELTAQDVLYAVVGGALLGGGGGGRSSEGMAIGNLAIQRAIVFSTTADLPRLPVILNTCLAHG